MASPSLTSGTVASPQQGSELILRVPGQQAKSAGEGRPASAENRPPAAVGRLRPSNRSTAPFDPIKENGPIFEGWPKPQVALVITGRQEGYLEPCGCAGLDRMKGGMSRRYTLFQTLRKEKGWPVVGLDVGDIAKGFGPQAELKFQTAVEGMRKMGYDAITLGCTDLRLPAGCSLRWWRAASPARSFRPTSACSASPPRLLAPYRIVEAGGKKFAITGVLGKSCQKQIHNNEIEMSDPETALKQIVPGMKQKADYLVLLANATPEESTDWPAVSRVRPGGHRRRHRGAAGPADDAQRGQDAVGGSGRKGRERRRAGLLSPTRSIRVRYQRVPLDSRFPASRAMKQLMAGYQDQLKQLGLRPAWASARSPHPQRRDQRPLRGLEGLRAVPRKVVQDVEEQRPRRGLRHAGQARPAAKLRSRVHQLPRRRLESRASSSPTRAATKATQKTPHLENVGCEDCHGPGRAPRGGRATGDDKVLQKKLQKAVRITKDEAADPRTGKQNCYSCHDGDNSPAFNFETYWPLIGHATTMPFGRFVPVRKAPRLQRGARRQKLSEGRTGPRGLTC